MSLMEIVTTLTTLSVVASAVCAATPTPKDDAFLSKYVYPVIEALALNVGKAKDERCAISRWQRNGAWTKVIRH